MTTDRPEQHPEPLDSECAGKEGSMLNALLADDAVVVSVALQQRSPAAAWRNPLIA